MSIYLTGDIHGDPGSLRYRFAKRKIKLKEDDVVIILGDAGFNYYTGARASKMKYDAEQTIPATIFCVHGNHEARPETIPSYKKETCFGGTVWVEDQYPRLKFAEDGERYTIGDKTFLVIGGAYSIDKYYRLAYGWNWFEDEQISEVAKAKILADAETDPRVDFVISHTCPLSWQPIEKKANDLDKDEIDKSEEIFMEEVKDKLDFDAWFFGHYHVDRKVNDKAYCLYGDVINLDEFIKGEDK